MRATPPGRERARGKKDEKTDGRGTMKEERKDRFAWRGRLSSFERRHPFPESLSLLARRTCVGRRTAELARGSVLHIPWAGTEGNRFWDRIGRFPDD